jgi:hypothetical protein
MLPAEDLIPYSEADVQAIDALFKRIAERGHRIRIQKQAIALVPVDNAVPLNTSVTQPATADENGQLS